MFASEPAPSDSRLRNFLLQQERRLAEAANETWKAAEEIHFRQTQKLANVNGPRHVEKVEKNIWRLLDETIDSGLKRNLERFSNVDLYLLSCAACCHDFDKGLDGGLLSENFVHGQGSAEFVYKNWERLRILSTAAAMAIAEIVSVHDCKDDFDNRLQKLVTSFPVEDTAVDLQLLATLLKAADTLQIDESRISHLAVPDDRLQAFDRQKQLARSCVLGWIPDGSRINVTLLIDGKETAEALRNTIAYIKEVEWPPISRNLQRYQFPYEINFHFQPPFSFLPRGIDEGVSLSSNQHFGSERIVSNMLTVKSVTAVSSIADEPLRLVAVPPEKLDEYLAEAGTLSVIGNAYVQLQLTELGASPGAVDRIFVGPANCGKTRAAYEWICDTVGLDSHAWVVLRPESGCIPHDISKFMIDFDRFYDKCGRSRPHKAIFFADDLTDHLPPLGIGSQASKAVHHLLELFRYYPGFQERRFTGTIRLERMHDRPEWPLWLTQSGRVRLFRVDPLNIDQRRDLWKGMSQGRSFRNQVFEIFDVQIDESFLDAVAAIEADPEAVAYYIRAMAERGKKRIFQQDAASFSTDAAKIWIALTWPTIFETYGTAACVFLTLARFIEAGARQDSGFRESIAPAWDYHAVFGPPLLAENGGKKSDYLEAVRRMLKDGHAMGVDDKWVRPRFDFLLQASKLDEIELPLPTSSWFARHADSLSAFEQTDISFHLYGANQCCTDERVTAHWLFGQGLAVIESGPPHWQQALTIFDELIHRFSNDKTASVRNSVAAAMTFKILILSSQGNAAEVLATSVELERQFGNDDTLAIREKVAPGIVEKGYVLGQLGRYEEALETFEAFEIRFGNDETSAFRGEIVRALFNKGVALNYLGRYEEALKVFTNLVNRFGNDMLPYVQEGVAKGLFMKGVVLGRLERNQEALETFIELTDRFDGYYSPSFGELFAMGQFNRGFALQRLGRNEEAVRAYHDLVSRFRDNDSPKVQEQVAKALYFRGVTFSSLGRNEEALRAFEDLVNWFGEDQRHEVQEQVSKALFNKSIILGFLGRDEEALSACDDFVQRFGEEQKPNVREQLLASVLYIKATTLNRLRRDEEALRAYGYFVHLFVDNGLPEVREFLAKALCDKGVLLGQLGRYEEAKQSFENLLRLFRDDEIPEIMLEVGKALYYVGVTLGQLGRDEEAIRAFENFVHRFGDDQTPQMQGLVASALAYQAGVLTRIGHKSQNRRFLEQAISVGRRAVSMGSGCYNLACALAVAGEVNEAFEWLGKCLERAEIPWSHVEDDADWETLRENLRYENLKRKHGPS